MNTDNPITSRGTRRFRSMFVAAVALMLAAVACSQTVEETAQTAAATTTTPTAAGTTTPDVSTATTAAVARDDGGGAEGADTTDASDEQATTGTEEPGAPDTTIVSTDTTEADAVDDSEADDVSSDTEEAEAEPDGDTEESDAEGGDGEEADTGETYDDAADSGDGEPDDTENGPGDEPDGETGDGEPEGGEPDDTEGEPDGDEEEETSGGGYPSTAEEAKAAGLTVGSPGGLARWATEPPLGHIVNYRDAGATPPDGEIWVPPSTGKSVTWYFDHPEQGKRCGLGFGQGTSDVGSVSIGDTLTVVSGRLAHKQTSACIATTGQGQNIPDSELRSTTRVIDVRRWEAEDATWFTLIACDVDHDRPLMILMDTQLGDSHGDVNTGTPHEHPWLFSLIGGAGPFFNPNTTCRVPG